MNVWICHDCDDQCVLMLGGDFVPDSCISSTRFCNWYKIDLNKIFDDIKLGDLNVSK